MNIFKALSDGNGRISETNITSFINYLLDSKNELKNSFFMLFANLIDSQLKNNKIYDLLGINQKTIREQIRFFSNKFNVYSKPEYTIHKSDGTKQIPDIFLKITTNSTEEELVAILIIENKINKSAIKIGQVERQFNYFKSDEDYDENKPVYSVLITPDDKAFERLYTSAIDINIRTVWLKWINHSDNAYSIEAILRQLIRYEQNAEIEPIDPNTQFILKSFIDYLATEYSFKENGRRNLSYNGFEVIETADVVIEKNEYCIKKFSNKMIRIFDKDDNLLEIDVKPILRKTNEIYELGIELHHLSGIPKNTQILGGEVINELKKKNICI